jgi:phospholipase/carboxylesterase
MDVDEEISETVEIDGWVIRQRLPRGVGPHPVIVLLHGWTGNESSMWIFASRLPQGALLIAPRGLYEISTGGYGWHATKTKAWPWVDDFSPAVNALLQILSPAHFPTGDFSQIRLVGFSQGAALAYTFALLHPVCVAALAGLSGFLPEGASALVENRPLQDKSIFIAHGSRDELVPVERARQSAELLQKAGAYVSYCEEDVGHRLSASCFRSLETFFRWA